MGMRSLMPILLVCLVACSVPGVAARAHAGDTLRLHRPFDAGLPDVLALVEKEGIRADAYRQALGRQVAANPLRFGLPDALIHDVMIRSEQVRLGIPAPTAQGIAARMARHEREQAIRVLGGEPSFQRIRDTFDAMLRENGLTRADMARGVELELLLEAVARKVHPDARGAELSAAVLDDVLKGMLERYDPVFRGMEAGVVARIGGQNYGRDDVIDFLLLRGQDAVLGRILEDLVDETLLVQEARRAGIEAQTAAEALQGLLGELLTPLALRQFYESRREEFAVIQARHIFLAFQPHASTGGFRGTPMRRGEEDVRAQALRIVRDLQADPSPQAFALAAEAHSDCLSKRAGGLLGYVAASPVIPHRIAPDVYLLDRIPSPRGHVSPIVPAPEEGVFRALQALEPGGISAPVRMEEGYAILMRGEARYPHNPDRILDLLGQIRFTEERDALLAYLRKEQPVAFRWKPGSRGMETAVLHPARELVMDRTATLRANVARIELPEFGD